MPKLARIALADIDEPALPIRSSMADDAMRELCDSMADIGLQQPILLVARGPRWEIVAGHRRYMAARRLHWTHIPALTHKPDEINIEAALLAENLCREDVNAAEEAVWYSQLLEKLKLDTDELAARLKRSRDYVEDRLRMMQQDMQVFNAVLERQINYSVARELNKCPDENMRRYFLAQAIAADCGARVVAGWVSQWKASQLPAPEPMPAPMPTADVPAVEPYKVCCALCGGDRDPFNLVTVMIHKWEWDRIQKIIASGGEAAAV